MPNALMPSAGVTKSFREAVGPVGLKVINFTFQSFFDSTLQLQAIQPQSQALIASETLVSVPIPGLGLGLHPDSQTPVAVQFQTGTGSSDSPVYFLTPGEQVWPQMTTPFKGLNVGLPFGWLGGGVAQLVIFKTPDSKVFWTTERPEVAFHRFRIAITASNAFQNGLPLRFASPNTQRSTATVANISQGGRPAIAVEPTRTLMMLRNADNGGDVKWVVKSPGNFTVGDIVSSQFTFPNDTGFPIMEIQSPTIYYAGDDAQISLNDASPDGTLAGLFVDVVRYGRV